MSARCPAWCTVDHAARFAFDLDAGMTLCESEPLRVELEATEYRPGRTAVVRLCQPCENGAAPDPVEVSLAPDEELTPGDARRLAAALIYAAELAEHLAVAR